MTERQPTAGDDPRTGSPGALGGLAASLATGLTIDEIEWLWRELKERTEKKRREAVEGQLPVLAGYRDAWERSDRLH
jgi:hypothetical protein